MSKNYLRYWNFLTQNINFPIFSLKKKRPKINFSLFKISVLKKVIVQFMDLPLYKKIILNIFDVDDNESIIAQTETH